MTITSSTIATSTQVQYGISGPNSASKSGISFGESLDQALNSVTQTTDSSSSVTVNLDAKTAAQYAQSLAGSIDLQRVYLNFQTGVTTDSSGNPVTPQSEAAFAQQESQVSAGRNSIYQTDMAAGKTPQQTLADMVNYMDKQSPDYLSQTNWYQARQTFIG